MVYVAVEQPSPKGEAILVPKGSSIVRISDLKGKTVALNKGSNVHYLLVQALAKAGLAFRDVNVVSLPPAEGRAALENGTIDAWVIWDRDRPRL
jgi:sulfonate transport system substrate-binding protein